MENWDDFIDNLSIEILRVLSKSKKYLSSQEITKMLKYRGLNFGERTIRNRIEKMVEANIVRKIGSKRAITDKGIAILNRNIVFERLGEFTDKVEYSTFYSTFNIYTMDGTVPTSFAIIKKEDIERALEVMSVVANSDVVTSRLVALLDEGETLDFFEIPKGKMGIGTISSVIYDVIMLNINVVLSVKYAGLLKYEGSNPVGLVELINYNGTTISPGLLFIRGGYTSVYEVATNGSGCVITAIRSFSPYAIDDVKKEILLAEARGIGKTLAISPPLDNILGLPTHKKALLLFQAGANFLAPLYEKKVTSSIKINEVLMEFKKFKDVDKLL